MLPFTVRNTGTEDAAYSLSADCTEGDAGWNVTFEDVNGSPITTTAILTQGADYPMQVRLRAPEDAQSGSYTRCTLTIASPAGGGTFEVQAQAAVAAPFAMTYVDDSDAYVQLITSTQSLTRKIFTSFTGAYLSLLHTGQMDYLLAGERSYVYPHAFKNINMYYFRATSNTPATALPLQNHETDPLTVKDSWPVMARTSDGQTSIAFLRQEKTDVSGQDINNVYFGRLNSRGELIPDLLNLTGRPTGAPETYNNIAMTVVPDADHYVAVWEKRITPYADIEIAIMHSNGSVIKPPTSMTNSQGTGVQYSKPRLVYLPAGRLAMVYKTQLANDTHIGYALLNPDGSLIGGLHELSIDYANQDIGSLTAAPMLDGKWLIIWVNDFDETLLFATLDNGGNLISLSEALIPFSQRAPDDVATTVDSDGNVIITWDEIDSSYLNYMLINPIGEVLTPPMPFRRGLDPIDPSIFSSGMGTGLTTCPDVLTWTIDLPIIRR